MPRPNILFSRVTQADDEAHHDFQLPTADFRLVPFDSPDLSFDGRTPTPVLRAALSNNARHKSAIGNRQFPMPYSLFLPAFAFLFLLTLANYFRLRRRFTFKYRCGNNFFLHNADGGDDDIRRG